MRLKCKHCGEDIKLGIFYKPFGVQCPGCLRRPFLDEKHTAGVWVTVCAVSAFIIGIVLFRLTAHYYRAWAAYMCIIVPALFFAAMYPLGNLLIAVSYKRRMKKREKKRQK